MESRSLGGNLSLCTQGMLEEETHFPPLICGLGMNEARPFHHFEVKSHLSEAVEVDS